MKTKLALLTALLLTGCMSPSKIVKELAKDPATASIDVSGWGVVVKVVRVNAGTNSMPHEINADGSTKVTVR